MAGGQAALEGEITGPGIGGYPVPGASGLVKIFPLDLEDLDSIQAFADEANKEARLDFVVLNAGVMAVPSLTLTKYGWEKQIATNHFGIAPNAVYLLIEDHAKLSPGHFYLTKLVRPKLEAQEFPSRIVAVSSKAHAMVSGALDVNDLHFKSRGYGAWTAYAQSKLANILFAKELADQLEGTPVTAVSLHPGVIATNLVNTYLESGVLKAVFRALIPDKSIPQGAATSLYGCLAPELDKEGRGAYLDDCAVATPNALGRDEDKSLRKALWAETEKQLAAALSS